MLYRLLVPEIQIATIANRMCFCVDLGQIATPTRFWNPLGAAGDSLEVIGRPTFDFARPRLRGLAQALAPAYLRIGGTEADRSFYALDGSDPTTPPAPFTSVLHARHLDAVGDFARAVGFELMLTVNAGWGARSVHGAWLSDQTRTLLRYVRTHSIPLTVLELGNEPNAWPYLQRGLAISPERYAQDLLALTSARDDELPGALVAAPATAFFPTIGEVPSIVASCWPPRLLAAGDFQARALAAAERLALPDIVTWHYYPGQSDRAVGLHKYRFAAAICLLARLLMRLGFGSRRQRNPPSVWMRFVSRLVGLAALGSLAACVLVHVVVTPVNLKSLSSPAVLDRVAVWGRAVRATTLAVEPPSRRPAVWLGETGSAQAGGQPGVSGRWAAALWWLDQLGSLSTLGQQVQCRQTLSGSDYGLLHEGTLEPTPEYWVSVLWKRLMGTTVLAASAEGAADTLRVYCHLAAPNHPPPRWRFPSRMVKPRATRRPRTTCLIINLAENPIELELPMWARAREAELWLLQGVEGRLDAAELTINGEMPHASVDGEVPSLPGAKGALDNQVLTLPAAAAAFVCMG